LPPGELTIIGTGHVFQVRDTIRGAILALRPDLVMVELDRGRLQVLLERQKGNVLEAKGGFIQKKLQKFQEEVAGLYGADVGEEMLAAVQAAQEVGAKVALIDPPAEDTVRRALKELTWREKFRTFGLLLKGGAQAIVGRGGKKEDLERELKAYQDDPEKALLELKKQFPTLYRIVIAERDALMARRIAHLLPGVRHGVAVVGDGHVPGLVKLLDDLKPTTFRLADVRDGKLPRPVSSLATGTSDSVSFGFDSRI
jgi:pheromone shutdown protein TraB